MVGGTWHRILFQEHVRENLIDMANRAEEGDPIIKDLWNEYKKETGEISKKKRFKYILRHFSEENEDYGVIIDEWTLEGCSYKGSGGGDGDDEGDFCVCSQEDIHYLFYIENAHNHNILRVGSECIKKITDAELGSSPKLFKQIAAVTSQIKYYVKGKKKHGFCLGCLKHKSEFGSMELCSTCQRDNVEENDVPLLEKHVKRCKRCKLCKIIVISPSIIEKGYCSECKILPKCPYCGVPTKNGKVCKICLDHQCDRCDKIGKTIPINGICNLCSKKCKDCNKNIEGTAKFIIRCKPCWYKMMKFEDEKE